MFYFSTFLSGAKSAWAILSYSSGPILEGKGMRAIFSEKGQKSAKKKYMKIWTKMYKIWKYFEKGQPYASEYRVHETARTYPAHYIDLHGTKSIKCAFNIFFADKHNSLNVILAWWTRWRSHFNPSKFFRNILCFIFTAIISNKSVTF